MLPDCNISHVTCSFVVKEVHSTAQPGMNKLQVQCISLTIHVMLELYERILYKQFY